MDAETASLIAGAAALLVAVVFVMSLVALLRARAVRRALHELTGEGEAAAEGAQLVRALAAIADQSKRLAQSEARLVELEAAADRAVSRIGHVQFQAYDDAGVGQIGRAHV